MFNKLPIKSIVQVFFVVCLSKPIFLIFRKYVFLILFSFKIMFFYIILCKVLLPKETNKVFKCMWSSSPLNRLMNLTKLALRGKWVHYKLLKRPIPVLQLSIINYVNNVNVKWFSDLHYSYEVNGGLFCTQSRSFYV